jgi:hypothetical protein
MIRCHWIFAFENTYNIGFFFLIIVDDYEVIKCWCIRDHIVSSCNGMKLWSATWHHIQCPYFSLISMFIDFFLIHFSFIFKLDPTCLWILNVMGVLHVFQSLSFLNVVWLESCAKCKCVVPKHECFYLLSILKHLCLSCVLASF